LVFTRTNNSKCPHIRLFAIFLPSNWLGSHPTNRTNGTICLIKKKITRLTENAHLKRETWRTLPSSLSCKTRDIPKS
jgi:hypothetical protein